MQGQGEPPGPVAASPPVLTPFQAQPAATLDADTGLRHRHSPLRKRIHVQTPTAEYGGSNTPSGAEGGWNVPLALTIAEVKDAIANGSAGYGLWERAGLRLVYHGRILNDADVLGVVLNVNADRPTLHLVARPIAASRNVVLLGASAAPASNGGAAPRVPSSSASPAAAALADCAHYLLFVAREHLCALLGTPALQWEQVVPPPSVTRAVARGAVASVLQAYSRQLGEGSYVVLETESADVRRALWERDGEAGVVAQIHALWGAHTGRAYSAGGEVLAVELDHITYNLNLPSLVDMTPGQLTHLLAYLRVTLLAPRVLTLSRQSEHTLPGDTPPTPTRTTADARAPPGAAPAARVVHQAPVRLRVPRFSFALLQHIAWSGLRLGAFVWMLTRHMRWEDKRLWGLVSCAAGWLLVDGYNRYIMETREERIRQQRFLRRVPGTGAANGGAGDGEGAPDGGAGLDLDDPLQAAAAARAAGVRPRDRDRDAGQQQRHTAEWNQYLAQYHLDVDSRQLRLPSSAIGAPRTVAGPPGTAPPGPMLRRAPLTRPGWWMTRLMLPIFLFFVTLVPGFEMRRARAIRRRERVMRQIVHQLTPLPSAEGTENGGELATSHVDTATQPVVGEPVFPDNISPAARRYYARVACSAESIDWDEEREAQRAMGIADED